MENKEIIITDEMAETLKKELIRSGVNAIEDFIGHDLDFDSDDTLDAFMDEVIEQMPEEDFMEYYDKYVTDKDSNVDLE